MGPLFSIGLMLLLAAMGTTILFVVAKFFLPFRASVLMAVAITFSAGIGVALGLLVQAPFYPETLQSTAMVLVYLGVASVIGLVAAVVAGYAVWRHTRQSLKQDPRP